VTVTDFIGVYVNLLDLVRIQGEILGPFNGDKG
jgi:hypothetical protein